MSSQAMGRHLDTDLISLIMHLWCSMARLLESQSIPWWPTSFHSDWGHCRASSHQNSFLDSWAMRTVRKASTTENAGYESPAWKWILLVRNSIASYIWYWGCETELKLGMKNRGGHFPLVDGSILHDVCTSGPLSLMLTASFATLILNKGKPHHSCPAGGLSRKIVC